MNNAQARQRKWGFACLLTVIVILVIFFLCLAITYSIIGTGARAIFSSAQATSETLQAPIDGYLQAMMRRDSHDALEYFSSRQQNLVHEQKLEDQLEIQPELYANYVELVIRKLSMQTQHEYGQESQSNALVEGMLAYQNEIFRSFQAYLVKESGQWFILTISIDPVVYDSVYGNVDFPDWFLPIWELFSPLWESLFDEWLNP